ncbi:MAG TPA: hypothetical protein VLE73_04790 [Candidatus Saccharimonadales bacterium]|nr:hypothetical protein [Candidatus Saccharimonadales bacterium]
MITTNEAIKDPIAFLQADPSIMIGQQIVSQVITAPDLDVLIEPTFLRYPNGRTAIKPVCRFLGDLYFKAIGYTELPNDTRYMLRWFLSSRAMNDLSEELGRKPGEDALKFETVPFDMIPDGPYVDYMAHGVCAESSGPDEFDHDRTNHRSGNFLLPPSVVRKVIQRAGSGDERLVAKFDDMSAVYNDIIQNCTTWETINSRKLLSGNLTSDLQVIDCLRAFWTKEDSPKKTRKFMADVGKQIIEHLEEIRPRVHEIQAARSG